VSKRKDPERIEGSQISKRAKIRPRFVAEKYKAYLLRRGNKKRQNEELNRLTFFELNNSTWTNSFIHFYKILETLRLMQNIINLQI